jgi:transcriptional regulator with XRE-family HTH domain
MAIRKNRDLIKQAAAGHIKKHRETKAVSQTALADSIGVSQPLVSAWERGKVAPSVEDLVNIEQALKLDRGELLLEVAYGTHQ